MMPPGSFTRSLSTLLMLASLLGASRARAAITVYPRVGAQADSAITPQGPGLVIMGGGSDVDGAFVWMHDTVVGAASTSGADVVILRATGDDAYDSYIAGLAPFNSVQTLLIPTPASASDLSTAAAIVDKAEVVFFAGGNQADYVGWKGSPLLTAVAGCHQRGGVVGGTSAGAAILGHFVFDAVAAGSSSVATADAVANPYESTISFTHDLLPFAILDDAITDPHFVVRDRMGRLTVFMARQLADGLAGGTTHGIGVDEGTAVCIDKHGLGVLMQYTAGTGSAFVVTGGAAATIQAGTPLRYPALSVTRLDQRGQTYDFSHWCGTTTTYALSVDGTAMPPYSPADPYAATGPAGSCNVAGSPDLGSIADAAVPIDAGADGSPDAAVGVGGNGGGGVGPAGSSHGCGCDVGSANRDAGGASLVCAVVVLLAWRRQRPAEIFAHRRSTRSPRADG